MNDTKNSKSKSNPHDELVPAPWVRALVSHWKDAHIAQVECRKGPKGALRCLDVVVLDTVDHDEDAVHVACEEICQRLWEKAYSYHLDVGGTVDAHLVMSDASGNEIARVTQGGRMRGGETEDPDEVEGGMTIKVALWAVEKMTKLHVATMEKFNSFIEAMTPYMAQAGQVEAARVAAEADIIKVQMVDDIVERAGERFGPLVQQYVNARANEATRARTRKSSGDKVVDAWRDLVEAVDMPTMHAISTRLDARDVGDLSKVLAVGDTLGRGDIVDFWSEFRERESVKEKWVAFLDALPERARRAFPELADAVREGAP